MAKDTGHHRHCENLAKQASFVRAYSPLTAALLDQAVTWLADPDRAGAQLGDVAGVRATCDRLAALLDASDPEVGETEWINDLDPALRLNAALHWFVLGDDPRVAELRPYYKTVPEGEGPEARSPSDPDFGRHLLTTVTALGADLFEQASRWRVISNETSRGLVWLLPATVLGVEAAHLIEAGCSAGLNLYAEQRRYDVAWSGRERLVLGRAKRGQFLTLCSGAKPGPLGDYSETERLGPEILSRVGGDDPSPFDLEATDADRGLEASVWGDQRRRLDRLREGIDIHMHAERDGLAKASVRGLTLPDDLPEFLAGAVPRDPEAGVLCFNTYVTGYLSDVNQRAAGRHMRAFARRWTKRHQLPWMWVRFEPVRAGQTPPPHPGWCQWVVEIFDGSSERAITLGWAHPYMIKAEFGPGLLELRALGEAQR